MENYRSNAERDRISADDAKSAAFDLKRIFTSTKTSDTLETKFKNAWKILEEKSFSEIGSIAKEYKENFLLGGVSRESNLPERSHLDPNMESIGKVLAEARGNLPHGYYQRLAMLVREKLISEIPEQSQRASNEFLKEGSNLEIGRVQTRTLQNGRTYEIYIPRSVNAFDDNGELKIPTIVGLHGVLTDREVPGAMRNMAGLNMLADRLGFAVIYPHAESRHALGKLNLAGWNIKDSVNILPRKDSYDDTEVIREMIADVRSQINVTDKVGMIGHSDGGRMAQFYAMRHPEEVAAIVPITSTWMQGDRKPEHTTPIPTRFIIGNKDNTLPFEGGRGWRSWAYSMVVSNNSYKSRPKEMLSNWAAINGCDDTPPTVNKSGIVESLFANCTGAPMRIDLVKGGGHPVPDWRNIDTLRPEAVELNLSYDAVKWVLPYIRQTDKRTQV